ncbi:GTPase-activating protein isoform X1 [Ischnura elegans]|uniref:GTPase-activating protein isoform X1 n=1 Tax=Ischnura elegans TaxID=197161 RepID=UPI001ED8BE66|nr:GTPase-activating protein isoform X1 [Ischnura elegans]
MAEGAEKVRVKESLKIKIGEAKNLPPRSHGSVGQREVYCTLSLDQEEIFRTTTSERSLNPFFGEEFQFEVPRHFRHLSVYVHDRGERDRPARVERALGKVAIKREELPRFHGQDHWFGIQPVDADSEVQGKVHIEHVVERIFYDVNLWRLSLRITECSDLTIKNGSCDPFATVTLCHPNTKQESKKTKVKKKTVCPRFDEVFSFEYSWDEGGSQSFESTREDEDKEDSNSLSSSGRTSSIRRGSFTPEVRVALWHDAPSAMSGHVFLGEVRLPLGKGSGQRQEAWYFLRPRHHTRPRKTDLGNLRLRIEYIVDHVLASHAYDDLRKLILRSPTEEPITSSAAYILGEVAGSKLDAAQPLVRVFTHHKLIVPLIRTLAQWEISKVTDVNTIFRGNSLVSKLMDEFMKLAGLHYLHTTLKPVVDCVIRERKPCEIDPTRVRDSALVEAGVTNLKEYVEKAFQAIIHSACHCPTLLCQTFHDLKELASTYFPENMEVRYSVISGFIFLRFFAPAILGPRLFDLTNEQIDSQTNRTFTLISKTIQSIGNLVSSRSSQHCFKEEYMGAIQRAFLTEHHINAVRQFLEIISASSNPGHRGLDSPVVLKEGVMIKRAQGRKKFGRKNFKRRYFRLTTQDLAYSKTSDSLCSPVGREPLCVIPLEDILAVERLHEDSFKMKNMFQIVQPKRALYVQASNCVEEKEWIDILTKICQTNGNRLKQYHPSAYVDGRWLCCKEMKEGAPGCRAVSQGVSEDSLCGVEGQRDLDPERQLERIRSLLVFGMGRLDAMALVCRRRLSRAVGKGDDVEDSKERTKDYVGPRSQMRDSWTGPIEDPSSCLRTLTMLQEAVAKLEKEHRRYLQTSAQEMTIGSKQAPIGDDNYLMLVAQGGHKDIHLLRKTYSLPRSWD